ncbi:hypothetical protein SH449x_000542 [Pirellulaceae bacterium SH449]
MATSRSDANSSGTGASPPIGLQNSHRPSLYTVISLTQSFWDFVAEGDSELASHCPDSPHGLYYNANITS